MMLYSVQLSKLIPFTWLNNINSKLLAHNNAHHHFHFILMMSRHRTWPALIDVNRSHWSLTKGSREWTQKSRAIPFDANAHQRCFYLPRINLNLLPPKICQARAWILSLGFTLAFGAMFSKVWRVHRFTTKAKADSKVINIWICHFARDLSIMFESFQQKKVEPWKLYIMVSILLAVDFLILGTWQYSDPLKRRLEEFPLEDPISASDDVKIRPELEHCESANNSVWLGERKPIIVQVL